MVKKKKYKFIFIFILLCFCDCKNVFAKSMVEVFNQFETGIVDIDIVEYQLCNGVEEYWKAPKNVMPGDRISKIPRIYNRGADCYIRVQILFSDINVLNEQHLWGMDSQWISRRDDYYYCTEILSHGKSVDVFQGVQIPTDLSDKFEEKDLQIVVMVEAIQSKNFTPDFNSEAPWGNVEVLKSEKKSEYDIQILKQSEKQLFRIEYSEELKELLTNHKDFFANFSCFMPGDQYVDSIELANDTNKELNLYFSSESLTSYEVLKKIQLHIRTKINGETIEIYDGNLQEVSLQSEMKIGSIPKTSKGEFIFEVQIPKELDNDYSLQDGTVKWIFSVEPDEDPKKDMEYQRPNIVQTGDTSQIAVYSILAAACLGLLGRMHRVKIRKGEK